MSWLFLWYKLSMFDGEQGTNQSLSSQVHITSKMHAAAQETGRIDMMIDKTLWSRVDTNINSSKGSRTQWKFLPPLIGIINQYYSYSINHVHSASKMHASIDEPRQKVLIKSFAYPSLVL